MRRMKVLLAMLLALSMLAAACGDDSSDSSSGSDDSGSDDVQKIVKSHPLYSEDNIIYCKNNPALGAVKNWNKLIKIAKGDYLMLLHHDECPVELNFFDELSKILKLKNLYNLFSKKPSQEIFLNIFPQFKYYKRLKIIDILDLKLRNKYDTYLVLAALILDQTNNYEYFCHKYKTSNKTKNRLKNISINFENFGNKNFYSEQNIKKLIYLSNKDYVKDLLLFSIYINKKIEKLSIKYLINYVDRCEVPKFPISGDYLIEHGYKTGELLGKKLKSLEDKWIKNNFIIEKEVIEESLGRISKI